MISDKLIYVTNRESEPESEVSHGIHSGKYYSVFCVFVAKGEIHSVRIILYEGVHSCIQLERNIVASIRIINILYPCFELTTLSCPVLYFLCYITEIISHQLGFIPVARFTVTSLAKEPSFLSPPKKI